MITPAIVHIAGPREHVAPAILRERSFVPRELDSNTVDEADPASAGPGVAPPSGLPGTLSWCHLSREPFHLAFEHLLAALVPTRAL